MKEIIEKAQELGKLIAASDRFKNAKAARKDVESDAAVRALLKQLDDQGKKMGDLQRQGKPIEPEDKHKLKELQEQVTVNPKLQNMMRTEADFSELMNKVTRSIYSALGEEREAE